MLCFYSVKDTLKNIKIMCSALLGALSLFKCKKHGSEEQTKILENYSCLFAGLFPRNGEFFDDRLSFFHSVSLTPTLSLPGSVSLCA